MKLCLALHAVVLAVALVKSQALASSEDAHGKIVGGVPVPFGDAPFQVSFQLQRDNGFHFCGGSIIDPNFIITAAHCCDAASSDSLQVLAGLNTLSNPEDDFQKINVTDIIIHPDYDQDTIQADACILRLKDSLILSPERRTAMIKLPPTGYMASGLANVTGWGDDGVRTDLLMRVQVPIVPDNVCRQSYPEVTDDMICAGEKGKDSCQGDSGGPMIDSKGFMVGIVSWGKGCGEAGYPGVYTEVSYFTRWIQTVVTNSGRTQNSTPTITKNRAVTSTASITGTESRHRNNMLRFLNQDEAIKVDEELFNEYKFSVDQLMELAGLSVASTIASVYTSKKDQKVLIICGPGNNGGDGMVAARHLKIFGFSNVTLLSARKPTKELFTNLIHQAERSQVDVTYDAASFQSDSSLGLVVDALFGFSFKPPVRPDYQPLMSILTNAHSRKVPVLSVDIPSGWDVEKGPPEDESLNFMPDTLVSLTAPKLCAKFFNGPNHYLGGRFVPQELQEKYSLNLPPYPGIECIVRLL